MLTKFQPNRMKDVRNIPGAGDMKKLRVTWIYSTVSLTITRHESTRQKVPDLPTPAEQCTTAGPTDDSKLPELK